MKRRNWLWLAIVLPILFIVGINETHAPLPHSYASDRCTWHCHDKGCSHFLANQAQQVFPAGFYRLYTSNIQWLKDNPLHLSYREMNILVYVILFPILLLGLLWGLFRKRK